MTRAEVATIDRPTVPRLENERAERYQARLEYLVAGPDRSLDAVSQRLGKSKALMERWSSADNWVEHARRYDDQMVGIRLQAEADAYRRDLEDHRKRYGDAGKALYQVAGGILQQLGKALAQPPITIEGKDGKLYKIPGIKVTPELLTTAARAMTIAADLEAHALRLGDILPRLDHDVLDRE